MPLTFAIVASLYFFTARRKRVFAEAFLLILTVHLLYVFALEANELTGILADRNVEKASLPSFTVSLRLYGQYGHSFRLSSIFIDPLNNYFKLLL